MVHTCFVASKSKIHMVGRGKGSGEKLVEGETTRA